MCALVYKQTFDRMTRGPVDAVNFGVGVLSVDVIFVFDDCQSVDVGLKPAAVAVNLIVIEIKRTYIFVLLSS